MFLAHLRRFFLGLALLAIAPVAAPAATRPVAIAVDVEVEGSVTRLSFALSREVKPRTFVMERPDRVVVDLPEVNFQLPKGAGRGRDGLVASFRYGLFAAGRSRVVIDLTQPALVSRAETILRPSDGAAVLIVELTRTERDAFRRSAKADEAALAVVPANPVRPAGPGDRRPLIVIDPGHGGVDPGAIPSAAVFEKDIVFAFAQRLRRRLDGSGRYRTLMTRDEDVFVALDERVRIARAARADLMISIHADSISAAPHVRGMTVYTGAERATDAESARLAERENKADAAGGVDAGARPADVADILQDLTQRETRGFSHRFAKRLLTGLEPVMATSKKPHREAGFLVLRAPDVPSVLVELGYLSSRKDINLLVSNEWRDRSTAAMAGAIDLYFGTRVATGAGPAAVSP